MCDFFSDLRAMYDVTNKNPYIAETLLHAGLIGEEEARAAEAEAGARGIGLLDCLADGGRNKAELFAALAARAGMEAVSLDPATPPPVAAQLVPAEVALRYRVVPLRRSGGILAVAVGDPFDLETLDTLRYILKDPVETFAALPEQIDATLARLYPHGDAEGPGQVGDGSMGAAPHPPPDIIQDVDDAVESDEPVIRLVNLLILEGYRQRASDIHLEPLANRFRVRYRIDGALRDVEPPPRRLHPPVISRLKIMAGMKISEKRLPQDGRIRIRAMGRDLDLRVSAIPSNHGESIVMRILDKQNLQLGLPNLGFLPDDQSTFDRFIRHPDGIVLITGPTGSGKTTTLYACLNHLNRPDRKIITVEDPVEYQLTGVNQVHVRPDIGLSFAAALRSILRQAPNIIMIGEIRDRETAEIAVNAALTGHLVLSTLHTNDAPSAVTRLADIGIKPFLVASALRGVVAQRLVRTVCGACRTAYAPGEAERLLVGAVPNLFRGEGCATCGSTGYFGRKGLFELLSVDDDLRQLIHAQAGTAELRRAARAMGMRTLREDGLRKAVEGETTLPEVLRATMKEGDS